MKKIFTLSILFCLGFVLTGTAQNSEAILSTLSKKAKNYVTVSASFLSVMEDSQSGMDPIQQSGSILIKGDKYKVTLSNYIVISDGKNIWTYDKESNFCSIDLLEDVENEMMDPSNLFTIWENDFKNSYTGEEVVKGNNCHVISLFPNNPNEVSFHTIILYVNKEKMEVQKIVSKGRDGTDVSYFVKIFEPNVEVKDTVFGFVKGDYPGVEMEDNRF